MSAEIFDNEEAKIPFDLDDCVQVNLMTLKNVITFMMNKINKNTKVSNQMINSNHEMKLKMSELEKTSMECKSDVEILSKQFNTR